MTKISSLERSMVRHYSTGILKREPMEKFNFNFYHWERSTPNKPFLRQPFGDKWEVYTWAEAGQMARKLATGLQSLGLPPKSHIGIVSKNCREWIIADIAILMAGYISVPFFPNLKADAIQELIELGDLEALFVGKLEDWEGMKGGVPKELPIVRFPHYEGNSIVTEGHDWTAFIEKFEPIAGNPSPNLDDIWTIIFTSGTTGTPKGVVIDYRALESTKQIVAHKNFLRISTEGENRFFCYLLLNHIAERVSIEQSCLEFGGTLSFAQSLETFAKNLQDAQPTLFFAVPRIWTKFKLGIQSKIPERRLKLLLRIPVVGDIIKKKLRQSLGMSNVRICLTGASPIAETTKDFFRRLDIPIAEGYGMTENCGSCTVLEADVLKPFSVGKPSWGGEIKVDEETGEILMRAPYLFREYYKAPEITAQTLKDGWLHTGDQGRIDEDGYLYITGRIKDTFKTSKGKFITPTPIEWHFEQNIDIEFICLLGLGCPQPLALIVLSEIGLAKSKTTIKESLYSTLQHVNTQVKGYEKVSTAVVVKEPPTIENGLLTPTLKVKRNKMSERYRDQLLSWHEAEEVIIFE